MEAKLESDEKIRKITVDNIHIESIDNYNYHIKEKRETRGRKMINVNFLPSDCKLCGEKFNSDKALGYHIRDVHVVGKKCKEIKITNYDENFFKIELIAMQNQGNSLHDISCPFLKYFKGESRKKKQRDYHYIRGKDWRVLNPKRPYCCDICGKRFSYENSLNHHKVIKHEEKIKEDKVNNPPKLYNHTFQCDQCGKILMSKHSLIRHLVSFHGTDHEKPFQCDICGQRYVSIASLVSHRRKEHTGDRPYVCEHCGKAFTMSNRLKCHLRVHSDEKFYKCQECSKQFKSCSAFRAHKDTHAGVMRHTCKHCGRKFLFQGNMIKHIRRRHKNCQNDSANNINNGNNNENKNKSDNIIDYDKEINDIAEKKIAKQKIQDAGHSCFNKQIAISAHNHLDETEHHRHNLSLSSVEQFSQPETQFLSSLSNQELFNTVNHMQAHASMNTSFSLQSTLNDQSNYTMQKDLSQNVLSARCRLCDETYPDIKFHIVDFHRIPAQKLDSFMPTMVYY